MSETKVDQKYKGVRRILRRLIIPKKQLTKYPKNKDKQGRKCK